MADSCVNLDPEKCVDSALVQKYLQTSVQKTEPKPITSTDGAVPKAAKLDIHPKMVPERVFFQPSKTLGKFMQTAQPVPVQEWLFFIFSMCTMLFQIMCNIWTYDVLLWSLFGKQLQIRWFLLRQLQDPWLCVAISLKLNKKTPQSFMAINLKSDIQRPQLWTWTTLSRTDMSLEMAMWLHHSHQTGLQELMKMTTTRSWSPMTSISHQSRTSWSQMASTSQSRTSWSRMASTSHQTSWNRTARLRQVFCSQKMFKLFRQLMLIFFRVMEVLSLLDDDDDAARPVF